MRHLPGSDLQMWCSSHSHSCEQCVPWSYTSQLNIMQTSSWWFHAADYIFDGLTSNRSSVWSNLFPRCDSSYAVSRLKPPNWGIYEAINHQLFSLKRSHTCLVIVYLVISSRGWWQWARKQEFRRLHLKRNLSHARGPFSSFRLASERNNLLSMENQMWGWNETIFILLAFPLLVIHHSDWKQWEQRSVQATKMTNCCWGTFGGSSYPEIRAKRPNICLIFFFPTWQNWFVFSGVHNSSCSAQTFRTGHELLPRCPSWGYHSKDTRQIGQNCLSCYIN